jgi:3-oxoacyl-[acyl-carrier protein] reductase
MGTYIIIGGSTGIGKSIVEHLTAQGHSCHVLSREERGITQIPGVSHETWDALSDDAIPVTLESIDGLVYCPGSINLKPFHRITDDEYVHEFKLNALGAVKAIKHFATALKKSGQGSVVLFSTVAVQTGMPFHSSIAMAKGAVEGLTRSLAAELAPVIRVNCVAPSLTQTPLADKLTGTPEKIEAGNKRHPLGRIGQPNDLAQAALFLLDAKNSWITGQILHVDGGMGAVKVG